MSNTEYGRPHMLRLDNEERDLLGRAVMIQIEDLSHALNAAAGGEDRQRKLRKLRALLERLSND
jgi:hypothetical protein